MGFWPRLQKCEWILNWETLNWDSAVYQICSMYIIFRSMHAWSMYTFSQCQHFKWQTELPFLQYWFQSREQVNISYRRVRRKAPVLLHGSLLLNPWPKWTSVLQHCCEEETNCWFSVFLMTPSLQQRKGSMCISLFTVLQFPSCSNFHKLYQRIPETFWSY